MVSRRSASICVGACPSNVGSKGSLRRSFWVTSPVCGGALLILLLSFIVAVQHGNPLGTSRTLWIGDSTVLLAPVEGVKIGFPGASIAQLQQALSHAMQSRDDYDQVIVMVVGQLYYGRSYASLMVDLNRLAIDIEENIGVRPLVIDPKVIRDLVRVEKFSYDNKHLTGFEHSLLPEGFNDNLYPFLAVVVFKNPRCFFERYSLCNQFLQLQFFSVLACY